MKLSIKHLLYYRWKGPSVGMRIKMQRHCYSVIIPIPQWFSDLLIYITDIFRGK